ncbi:MAG: ABC transporter ATP-binding protein [Chloroflexi bacterium]|nr:ABC transporter ATP-binding protein [Chloroflexota bacterium]
MIETRGLTKRYGKRVAVDGVSLSVRSGEIYGFLGPNGAGKTTTILMLLGILRPDSGDARIGGERVSANNLDMRRLVGAVSETQHLYGDLSIVEYLAFFARLYRVDHATTRIETVLDEVGLSSRAGDRAVHLSRGLQQKLGLARALLHDPPVLILDEPVSGLDPHGIREVREIIVQERARGRCIFLSSHVLSEIERTADRVAILHRGRLLVEDATARVREHLPGDVEVEVQVDGPAASWLDTVLRVPGVRSATAADETLVVAMARDPGARRALSVGLNSAGAVIVGMRERQTSLEDAFVTLTDESIHTLVGGAAG